jgi:hypothetical protein
MTVFGVFCSFPLAVRADDYRSCHPGPTGGIHHRVAKKPGTTPAKNIY